VVAEVDALRNGEDRLSSSSLLSMEECASLDDDKDGEVDSAAEFSGAWATCEPRSWTRDGLVARGNTDRAKLASFSSSSNPNPWADAWNISESLDSTFVSFAALFLGCILFLGIPSFEKLFCCFGLPRDLSTSCCILFNSF